MLGLFTRATFFDFLRGRDTEQCLSITLASVLVILLLIAIYPLDRRGLTFVRLGPGVRILTKLRPCYSLKLNNCPQDAFVLKMQRELRHPKSVRPKSFGTFRTYFGCHNSLCIFKTKASRGTKLCSYFDFYSLYNI